MEAGVYKDSQGSFGYLNSTGNYVPKISRTMARKMAIEEGFRTTLKGTYTPPIEQPEIRSKRAYRKLNLGGNRAKYEIIIEVSSGMHYNTTQAFLMYRKKHRNFRYAYARTDRDTTIFIQL